MTAVRKVSKTSESKLSEADKLFNYLQYDGSKKDEIFKYLVRYSGVTTTVSALNGILERNVGKDNSQVRLLNERLEEVNSLNDAKYCCVNSGLRRKIRNCVDTLWVAIIKGRFGWTGGFVETYENLVDSFRSHEAESVVRNNNLAVISNIVMEAKKGGASDEEISKTVVELKEHFMKEQKKTLKIADSVIDNVKEYMLDSSEFWSDKVLKVTLSNVLQIASREIGIGNKAIAYMNKDNTKAVVNSGLLDDDCNYILLLCEVDIDGIDCQVTGVSVFNGVGTLEENGFDSKNYIEPVIVSKAFDTGVMSFGSIDDFCTSDRRSLYHCVAVRGDRSDDKNELSVKELRRRLIDSVELCYELESKGINVVAPFYSLETKQVSWLFPAWFDGVVDIKNPNAFVLMARAHGEMVPFTLLDANMAHKDAFGFNIYCNAIWFDRNKVIVDEK